MPGLGRKVFTRERATVADVNGYLMDQAVMRFASASARNAAIPAPTEGMHCTLDDTNQTLRYSGSTWVPVSGVGGLVVGAQSDVSGVYAVSHGLGATPRLAHITPRNQPSEGLNSVIKLLLWDVNATQLQIRTYRHDGTNGVASPFSTLFNFSWSAVP